MLSAFDMFINPLDWGRFLKLNNRWFVNGLDDYR